MENISEEKKEYVPNEGGTKFLEAIQNLEPGLIESWRKKQMKLKNKIIEKNDKNFTIDSIKYIGGMDISMSQKHDKKACASLVVTSFPDMKVAYKEDLMVDVENPYVPSFLAFKEVPAFELLFENFTKNSDIKIDVFLMDGNGILHTHGCGIASHFGVMIDKPTIGCAKKIFDVDGIDKSNIIGIKEKFKLNTSKKGDFEYLKGDSGRIWAAALKSTKDVIDPYIVSIGHKITLESAVEIVTKCCFNRVAEPIRIADKASRQIINAFDKNFQL